MTTIITANIGGTVYTVDEDAYDALRHYLSEATARLRSNPDRSEIVADLERSIAEKLTRRTSVRTGAVSKTEILEILHEIGMVDGDEARAPGADTPPQPRGLYRIHEGQQIAGVCTGLAAYAELDVTLVRVLFVLLTIFSGGVGALVYLVMMFAVPVAHSAQATTPVTARP